MYAYVPMMVIWECRERVRCKDGKSKEVQYRHKFVREQRS